MPKIDYETKKAEAIRWMNILGIDPDVIQKFKDQGIVSACSGISGGFIPLDDPELLEEIHRFEQEWDNLVYFVVRTPSIYGQLDSLLFMDNYSDEWEFAREELKDGYVMTWTLNRDYPSCSDMGIFEKFYIISNDEVELDIEFSFRPPFDKLLEPIKDDIAQINKNKSSNRIGNALTIAKGHIQEFLECGLSDVDNPSNMSTYSNDGYFFRHKSLSKVLLVDLSQLYSNPFLQIRSFKQRIDPQISAHSSEPLTSEDKLEAIENISPKRLNVYGETEVCRIRQKQKVLSDIEIQTVCKRYRSGDSVYKLAKDFECHRSTISAVLKRNGVEVTHLASKKPELVKKVIELYAERKDSIF